MVDGRTHWFGVCGLCNGLAVMADEETRSYWDHISGEAFEGPLTGHTLATWPISITTVEAMQASDPNLQVYQSTYRSWGMWFMQLVSGNFIQGRGFLPPGFRATMHEEIDPRRPKMENGLGVIADDVAKFYPMNAISMGGSIEDLFAGKVLIVERGAKDGVPFARWRDTDQIPMQLLSRWYGFSFTYPDCDVYKSITTR